ncbi:MAG: N-acetyltransferase [Hyphomicrobiaceae bacterium]|nr:N-acetyltransferase [Hyphomicrobiaceae bacterium]
MTAFTSIRPSVAADEPALKVLYPSAFPDEDLRPLVGDLLRLAPPVLSLVAEADGEIVGHIAFTPCRVDGHDAAVAMLAPLAVKPSLQRRGIGRALIETGIARLEGMAGVVVLGDPGYYGQFGFKPERGINPPYPLPSEWEGAWQSLPLGPSARPLAGTLLPPSLWLSPALWGP